MAATHQRDCYPCRGTGRVIGFGRANGAPCPAVCGCECDGCGQDCGCSCCPEPDLEACNGGCGEQVAPNAIGVAWCGQVNCRTYAQAEHRADMYGGT